MSSDGGDCSRCARTVPYLYRFNRRQPVCWKCFGAIDAALRRDLGRGLPVHRLMVTAGCATVSDVARLSDEYLRSLPGIGSTLLRRIRQAAPYTPPQPVLEELAELEVWPA